MREEDQPVVDVEVAGQKARLRGYRSMDVIGIFGFLAMCACAFLLWNDFKQDARAAVIATAKEHQELRDSNRQVAVAVAEFAWILTLKQDDREKLNLAMPESLRNRLYEDPRRGR